MGGLTPRTLPIKKMPRVKLYTRTFGLFSCYQRLLGPGALSVGLPTRSTRAAIDTGVTRIHRNGNGNGHNKLHAKDQSKHTRLGSHFNISAIHSRLVMIKSHI